MFARQRYREALDRYKSAVVQAPDLAETFLREGFVFVAIGQYESAGKAMRRGLKLQSAWRPDDLRLDRLYGPEKAARQAHVEALAIALQATPHNATVLFLLGMELFFDGEAARSAPFFTRAAQLGGNEDQLLDGLLGESAAAAAPPAGVPAAGIPGAIVPAAARGAGPADPPAANAARPVPDRGPILDL